MTIRDARILTLATAPFCLGCGLVGVFWIGSGTSRLDQLDLERYEALAEEALQQGRGLDAEALAKLDQGILRLLRDSRDLEASARGMVFWLGLLLLFSAAVGLFVALRVLRDPPDRP